MAPQSRGRRGGVGGVLFPVDIPTALATAIMDVQSHRECAGTDRLFERFRNELTIAAAADGMRAFYDASAWPGRAE